MRTIIILLVLLLSSCALLQNNDTEITIESGNDPEIMMTMLLKKGDNRAAYDLYNDLSQEEKSGQRINKKYLDLQKNIATIRKNTEKTVEHAIRKGEWKQAIDLYNNQMALIEIDDAFKQNYSRFVRRHQLAIRTLNDSFLIVRAEYLIKELALIRASFKLDPYNSEKQQKLQSTEEESKEIAKQLLEFAVKAIREKDIATARALIPLAKQLHNNKAVTRASRALEKITGPFDEHIDNLIEQRTQRYRNEQYTKALEKWNEILFLDPNNAKIVTIRERTKKILQSLEDLKQKNILDN